ncbi:hypothetical protein ACVGXT_00245, partial [Enterobacter intestinihominis]
LFRLMQAVGDQGMGVFVEHGVSFVRLLPGGGGRAPPPVSPRVCRGRQRPPRPKIKKNKIKKKKKEPHKYFVFF